MQATSKNTMFKRVIVVLLVALLALTIFNAALLLERPSSSPSQATVLGYDFVLSQKGMKDQLQNELNGSVTSFFSNESATALNTALSIGNSVYINAGNYTLNQDVVLTNKTNAKIDGNNPTIIGNQYKIIIYGDNYTVSQYSTISDLTIVNGTIRIENSFGTTISNVIFENTTTCIEVANTRSWSEDTQIDNCYFINATEGIAFRTPTGNGTGSYESSEINGCFFNVGDNSVGIKVEPYAEFSDSELQNIRMWMGQDGETNQTGILCNGTMDQTVLFGVVFESFATLPVDMYPISLGQYCNPAPYLDSGVNYLGSWTADIHNPYGKWVSGAETAFEEQDVNVAVGLNDNWGAVTTIDMLPQMISSFKPEIIVIGNFLHNETITVRIRLAFADSTNSNPVEKSFTTSQSEWLTDNDMLQLFPAESVISAVLIDAKCSTSSTDATVTVCGYGTAG